MKFFLKVVFVLIFVKFEAEASVINFKEYIEDILKDFVQILEKAEITGNGLPLSDWSGTINSTQFGVTAIGTVKFDSGFVHSMDLAAVDSVKSGELVTDDYAQVQTVFYFSNVRFYYDMEIDFTGYRELGNIMILIPKIEFTAVARHHFKTNEKTLQFSDASLTFTKMAIKQYPNNGYTQLINQQIFLAPVRTALVESVQISWKNAFQKYLDAAIMKADYPEICYHCQQLEL